MAIFMKTEQIAALTDPEQLLQLARTGDELTRYAVAWNPGTPGEALEELAKEDGRMRRVVAQNPNTPVAVLAELATEPLGYVRIAVARNASTPVEVLDELVCDPDLAVRFAASENPSAPATWVQVVEATLAKLQEAISGCKSPEGMDSARAVLIQCAECADKAVAIFAAHTQLSNDDGGRPGTPGGEGGEGGAPGRGYCGGSSEAFDGRDGDEDRSIVLRTGQEDQAALAALNEVVQETTVQRAAREEKTARAAFAKRVALLRTGLGTLHKAKLSTESSHSIMKRLRKGGASVCAASAKARQHAMTVLALSFAMVGTRIA